MTESSKAITRAERQVRSHDRLRAVTANGRRILKSAAGAALMGVAAWYGYSELILTRSSDATVSTEFVTVAAPIEGYVRHHLRGPGDLVEAASSLGAIDNPLLDNSTSIDVQARLVVLDGDIESTQRLVDRFSAMIGEFEGRGRTYLRKRSNQLELGLAQMQARVDGQRARTAAAQAQLQRMERLRQEGLVSQQQVEDSRRDAIVDDKMLTEALKGLEQQQSTIDSAKAGVTTGDYSSSDRAYSDQRADEVAVSLAQLKSQLSEKQARRTALVKELADLEGQSDLRMHANLKILRRSRVWALLASNNEWVSHGQAIAKMLDCTRMRVVVYLSRRKFDSVRVGQVAEIELVANKRRFDGTVALTIGKHKNNGTLPPLTDEDDYEVVVDSPALAESLEDTCEVGQRADVLFRR